MHEERQGGRRRGSWRRLWCVPALISLLTLAGCGFFVNPAGTVTTSANAVYVINAAASTVSGYVIGAGTLTGITGLPGALGFAPQAAVVSLANTYLWVAGPTSVYAYSIGTSGALTAVGAVADATVVAMDVSPDGQWVIGLDSTTQAIDIFAIDTSTGGLTLQAQYPYTITSGIVVPRSVRVSPGGSYIFAALGTAGDAVFSFVTSTGVAAQTQTLATGATTLSDNAAAVNSAGTQLFIARSGSANGVMVYAIGSAGALTPVTGSPFGTGTTPYALQMDATGTYLYAANRGDGTISGFSIGSTGVLTALTTSPFTSGSLVQSLALDSTGTYLFSAAYGGAPDLTMYSFSAATAGALIPVTTETPASNDGSVMVVATH